ncbi:hypothetical protein EV702DRAFT_142283 [Suillus placidus]|uniref:DUF6535 domain-containing protein n=1 Tax=Suillus placidus TaxID=48579 RepID=A0A9P6ZZ89_9AGAM|nr:hypothetical protein EV702DRAFT_142283 [Suillus placidus]
MVTQGRGTLEERGKERQMKLDGVEYFRLQTVLQSFLVLLQISLLLFGLSLSANMWARQTTIASVIISTTAFGLLFYACTILVSALRLDSPFQTPGSELFVAICKKILPKKFVFTPNMFVKSSAIRWILETSTNPEIINTAAAIVPSVQWRPNLDASASYGRLLDNFLRCCDKPELCLNYQKAMAHLCIQPVKIDSRLLKNSFWNSGQFEQNRNRLICDAFTAGRAAYDQFRKPVVVYHHDHLRNPGFTASQLKHLASVRTALRAMLVHGLSYQLSRPDDEDLIWHGNLRWDHSNG